MKTKILGIVLLLVIGLGISQIHLFTAEQAPGGEPAPAGNCPCYYVGEVISEGGWYQSGVYYFIIETFIGNCTIRQDWYADGQWFQTTTYNGGCTCECPSNG